MAASLRAFVKAAARIAQWVWDRPYPQRAIPVLALGALTTFALALVRDSGSDLSGVPNPVSPKRPGVFVSSASNPLPDAGFPHGRGFTRADFPDGYSVNGVPRPSFDNFLGGGEGELGNERHLLATCFRREEHCLRTPTATDPIEVAPGDELLVSALVDNNGDPVGNKGGRGPAVARDTRISFNWDGDSGLELGLGAFIRASNAVVDEARPHLRTVSDNLTFRSATDKPVRLHYRDARMLVADRFDPSGDPGERWHYSRWYLTDPQEYWLFTGTITNVAGNSEASGDLGLPIGSDGSGDSKGSIVGRTQRDRLNFYAGEVYHALVQFRVVVQGRW
jgi:hypothetical protein